MFEAPKFEPKKENQGLMPEKSRLSKILKWGALSASLLLSASRVEAGEHQGYTTVDHGKAIEHKVDQKEVEKAAAFSLIDHVREMGTPMKVDEGASTEDVQTTMDFRQEQLRTLLGSYAYLKLPKDKRPQGSEVTDELVKAGATDVLNNVVDYGHERLGAKTDDEVLAKAWNTPNMQDFKVLLPDLGISADLEKN